MLLALFCFAAETALAQVQTYKEMHKVKRKETIFGIARENGLTVQELIDANPEMNSPGYELKKGDFIKIPFPADNTSAKQPSSTQEIAMPTKPQVVETDMRQREIRVGIMLPLHNINGDGKRMVEYYRGILMACDSLRANGISTDVRAWNVAEDTDINEILQDPHAADRDLIIGPLYTKQVKALGDFARQHNIRVMIPFSINSPEVFTNAQLFQVYQNGNVLNDGYVARFYERYKNYHTVIIDCNDTTSTKGGFTSALRRKLEMEGKKYSITNLRSGESMFQKSFSTTEPNVVVLNTSRSQELNVAFAKLNGMTMTRSQIQVAVFGYPEWLMYTSRHLDNFYKYDVCIPSTYYMNPVASSTARFKQKYRWNFHQDMQNYHQRYAVTGFDHAYFFIKGLHMYGHNFTGASGMVGYTPYQTPLHFERLSGGGLQNRARLFVHYTKDQRIETINY
jgi:murein DD-endopeptidase MepM/ murein hydrolase activator NlpD